jgi:hypothetical protein
MASKAPKPTIRELAGKAICPNCGGPVVKRSARGPMPKFCDAKGKGVCKRAFETRAIVEGRALAPLLKAWRIDRGSGEIASGAFAQVCQITDQFNAADNAAGRPRADLYAAKLLADGTMFFDRQRTYERPARQPEPQAEEAQPDLAAILQMIANGHNDPRALAESVLALQAQ